MSANLLSFPLLHNHSLSGDEGTRTPDPRLAKAVLSQLSYIPILGGGVGLTGFEPVTPALSAQCSNQLSYRPSSFP